MTFATVPQWAWLVLGLGVLFYASRTGLLENLLKMSAPGAARPVTGVTPGMSLSLLDSWQGDKIKLAALIVAVLAANELWHFISESYVTLVVYLAGALGLYGVSDAMQQLKQKLDQMAPKT